MKNVMIEKATFEFLRRLSKNNDRAWFAAHKNQYLQAHENAAQFMDALLLKMTEHDDLENTSGKKSLYRIYNDVRFSSDKKPYSTRFAGYIKRTKPLLRGGYYIWLAPGGSHIACGFSHPNAADLKRLRLDIADNHIAWRKLIKARAIVRNFGEMTGEQVKTVPRGFAADHLAVDLLRFKQYWFERQFTDSEVLSVEFIEMVNKAFKSIRPFFDYTSEVLTTNLDGEPMNF